MDKRKAIGLHVYTALCIGLLWALTPQPGPITVAVYVAAMLVCLLPLLRLWHRR